MKKNLPSDLISPCVSRQTLHILQWETSACLVFIPKNTEQNWLFSAFELTAHSAMPKICNLESRGSRANTKQYWLSTGEARSILFRQKNDGAQYGAFELQQEKKGKTELYFFLN